MARPLTAALPQLRREIEHTESGLYGEAWVSAQQASTQKRQVLCERGPITPPFPP